MERSKTEQDDDVTQQRFVQRFIWKLELLSSYNFTYTNNKSNLTYYNDAKALLRLRFTRHSKAWLDRPKAH